MYKFVVTQYKQVKVFIACVLHFIIAVTSFLPKGINRFHCSRLLCSAFIPSPGLIGVDIAALGIPSEEEMIETYSGCRQVADLKDNWNFYLAFTFFRVAAILQGVYKRSLQSKSTYMYI